MSKLLKTFLNIAAALIVSAVFAAPAIAQEADILPPVVTSAGNLSLEIKSEDDEQVTVALKLDKAEGQKFLGFDVVLGVEGNLEFEESRDTYGDCDVSIHETNRGAISVLCLKNPGEEIDDDGDLALMTFLKNGTGRVTIVSTDFGNATVDASDGNAIEVRKSGFISSERPIETAANLLRLAIPIALGIMILFIFLVYFKVAQRNRSLQLSLGLIVGVFGLSTAVYLLTDGRNLGLNTSADDTEIYIASVSTVTVQPTENLPISSEFDINADGKVNIVDYKLFLESYTKFQLEGVVDNERADLVKDNKLDVRDYKRFVDGYIQNRLGNS